MTLTRELADRLLQEQTTEQLIEFLSAERVDEFVEGPDPKGSGSVGQQVDSRDRKNLVEILRTYFWNATPLSRQIAKELGVDRDRLIRLFQRFREIRLFQDFLVSCSLGRRQISFLRELLLAENVRYLEAILHAGHAIPFSVEFHPARGCNLACMGCPNIQKHESGKWRFCAYPEIVHPLDESKLKMIIDMFFELGVRKYSFAGGGEPTISKLTRTGIEHLRASGEDVYIALYTNGVFEPGEGDTALFSYLTNCNKIRFSIDATTEQDWIHYKCSAIGEEQGKKLYDRMRDNLHRLVRLRAARGRAHDVSIGASCLLTKYSLQNLESFLRTLQKESVDFCDIKELAISSEDKREVAAQDSETADTIRRLLGLVESGTFHPMNVAFDESLVRQAIPTARRRRRRTKSLTDRCWVSINGRLLTIGPYGELQPCCDADNPGFQKACVHKLRLGTLTDFEEPSMLRAQFDALWEISLRKRMLISQANCPYCVPSNFNYNFAMEKLYQDWVYGISPVQQPIGSSKDPYLEFRATARAAVR